MQIDGEHEEDELLLDTPADEQEQDEAVASPEGEDNAEPDEFVLEIEGEDAGNGSEVVKRLRDRIDAQNAQLKQYQARETAPASPGKEPDLWEDCEGDPDKYKQALLKWQADTNAHSEAERKRTEAAQAQERKFERLRERHRARAEVLRIPDFDQAERALIDAIGADMVGAALVMADDSAKLVAAIGRNPTALAKLQAEDDPLLKLKMLMKMESQIMTKTRKAPEPTAQHVQRGTVSVTPKDSSKELARLEKEAERTGDRTKIIAYKRTLRQKAAA